MRRRLLYSLSCFVIAITAFFLLGMVRSHFGDLPTSTKVPWKPVIRNFNGVEMVEVPPGCFTMGSNDLWSMFNASPAFQMCFEKSFWIDKNLVSNAQFARFNGIAARPSYSLAPQHPRESITWYEARDFCILRGARLPTEAEWEYAARGPDSLIYPWGNNFDPTKTGWYGVVGNTTKGSIDVGSKPEGASWVGALDMEGNVWQWTNTIFKRYPYKADDGREEDGISARVRRGSWWDSYDMDLQAAARLYSSPQLFGSNAGFRCARSE